VTQTNPIGGTSTTTCLVSRSSAAAYTGRSICGRPGSCGISKSDAAHEAERIEHQIARFGRLARARQTSSELRRGALPSRVDLRIEVSSIGASSAASSMAATSVATRRWSVAAADSSPGHQRRQRIERLGGFHSRTALPIADGDETASGALRTTLASGRAPVLVDSEAILMHRQIRIAEESARSSQTFPGPRCIWRFAASLRTRG
jgi:hypothetical protein